MEIDNGYESEKWEEASYQTMDSPVHKLKTLFKQIRLDNL